MANLILRPDWHLRESVLTPEGVFRNRRQFLRQLGLAGAGALALSAARPVRARRTWLTHISHDLGHADLEAALDSQVKVAWDGLVLEF